MRWCLAILLLLLCPALAAAQESYEIRVQVRKQVCDRGACRIVIGEGNAVVFAANQQGIWSVTAAHNVADSQQIKLLIGGQEHQAQIGRSNTLQLDQANDVAVVFSAGDFSHISAVPIHEGDVPDGAEVEFRGYSPVIENERITSWRYGRATTRVRHVGNCYYTGLTSTVTGNSGAGYYYQGRLVAIHRGKFDQYSGGCTSSVVRTRLIQWGYTPATPSPYANQLPISDNTPLPVVGGTSTPGPPVERGVQPTPPLVPGGPMCACDARFVAIEKRLEQSINQLNLQINAISQKSTSVDSAKLIAMQAEIEALRADLEALKPLMERRVILVSDGKVTSQRTLKPSDPLVLGSEIVVRKSE